MTDQRGTGLTATPVGTTKPIELAFITTHATPARGYGGAVVAAGNLLLAWRVVGHRVAVCTSDASTGPRLTREEIARANGTDQVRVYRARYFPRWGFGWNALQVIWETISAAPAVYVNGVGTWPTTLGAWLSVLLGRPFTIGVHGGLMAEHVAIIRRSKPHKWLFYRWLTFPTLRRARAIHCTSLIERDGVIAALGAGLVPPIAIVGNGVTLPASPAPSRSEGPFTVCYAGRISREKGINRLVKIWRGWRRDDERLIVAGGGEGAYFAEFQALVGADPTVRFIGYVDSQELAATMAASDFVALPSGIEGNDIRENFGIAVAEALALGRPALVTRGLAWDGLEAAGAGILFGVTDGDIVGALDAARAGDRAAHAKAARQYAERHLSISVTAEALWRVCRGDGPGKDPQ